MNDIEIKVYEQSPGIFCATIAGGWWMSVSTSKEKAIEQVIQRYKKELEYLGMEKPA